MESAELTVFSSTINLLFHDLVSVVFLVVILVAIFVIFVLVLPIVPGRHGRGGTQHYFVSAL